MKWDAFKNCTGLTITIPNSVTRINEWAFKGCENPTIINITDSVTSVGDEAFKFWENLTIINIPDNVTSIGKYAFSGCTNLTIHTPTGSYAEQYAQNNKINLVTEKI